MEKELKKLSRRELVDVIYRMKKNEEQMQEEIAYLQYELEDKRIRISDAGSIADAAAEITQIFSSAQETAELYLNEIACMKEETEKECEKKIEDARILAQTIVERGERRLKDLKACFSHDYKKWKRLQLDIQALEKRKRELREGIRNEKQF